MEEGGGGEEEEGLEVEGRNGFESGVGEEEEEEEEEVGL